MAPPSLPSPAVGAGRAPPSLPGTVCAAVVGRAWAPGGGVPGPAASDPRPAERFPPGHPADTVGHVQPGSDPLLHPAVPGLHRVSAAPQGGPPAPHPSHTGPRSLSWGRAGPCDQEVRKASGGQRVAQVGPRTGGSSEARDWQVGTLWLEDQLRARSRSSQSERLGTWHPTSARAPAEVLVTTSEPPARTPHRAMCSLPPLPHASSHRLDARQGVHRVVQPTPSQQPARPP